MANLVGDKDPFERMPEVPLLNIISFIDNPDLKADLSLASKHAAKLLEPSKPAWLFNRILSLPNLHDLLITKSYKIRDILQLRLVCKDWKIAVDNFLSGPNNIQPDYSSYKTLTSKSTAAYVFRRWRHILNPDTKLYFPVKLTPTKLDKCLEMFDKIPGAGANPFPTREIQINFDFYPPGMASYFNKLISTLEKYGENVQKIKIIFNWISNESFEYFARILWKLPELNYLSFKITPGNFLQNFDQGQVELPKLANLKRLNLEFCDNMSFYPKFSCYFDQLVSLRCENNGENLFMDWFEPEIHSKFPNLQHLSVQFDSFEALLKLRKISSVLKEIEIKWVGNAEFLSPEVYFYSLENFRDSLVAIVISDCFRFWKPTKNLADFGVQEGPQIIFKNLKALSISAAKCGCGNLDNLLNLSKPPEYLEVAYPPDYLCSKRHSESRCGGESKSKLSKYLADGYKSIIWNLWQELKEFHIMIEPRNRQRTVSYYRTDLNI